MLTYRHTWSHEYVSWNIMKYPYAILMQHFIFVLSEGWLCFASSHWTWIVSVQLESRVPWDTTHASKQSGGMGLGMLQHCMCCGQSIWKTGRLWSTRRKFGLGGTSDESVLWTRFFWGPSRRTSERRFKGGRESYLRSSKLCGARTNLHDPLRKCERVGGSEFARSTSTHARRARLQSCLPDIPPPDLPMDVQRDWRALRSTAAFSFDCVLTLHFQCEGVGIRASRSPSYRSVEQACPIGSGAGGTCGGSCGRAADCVLWNVLFVRANVHLFGKASG